MAGYLLAHNAVGFISLPTQENIQATARQGGSFQGRFVYQFKVNQISPV